MKGRDERTDTCWMDAETQPLNYIRKCIELDVFADEDSLNSDDKAYELEELLRETKQDELLDERSEGDYDEEVESETAWKLDLESFNEIETKDISIGNLDRIILYDHKYPDPFTVHRCRTQDKLLVLLGVKYALTQELPVEYTPFLLINIILEAAVYHAFTGNGVIDKFCDDIDRIRNFVKPYDDSDHFIKSPKYFRKALFCRSYVRNIARHGPFAKVPNGVPVAYRHRPWNSYFRGKLPISIRLGNSKYNYEGNPFFVEGRVQHAEYREEKTSGEVITTIIRGQRIRAILDKKAYKEYCDSRVRGVVTKTVY